METKEIKIDKTETYLDGQEKRIVCKGKLILSNFLDNKKNLPLIVSETERIEIGDKHTRWNGNEYQIRVNKFNSIKGSDKKILAVAENFSPEILKKIADGKLKDGDEVLVECFNQPIPAPKRDKPYSSSLEMDSDYRGYDKIIRLYYPEKYIQLFPVKKEENWDDIFNNCDVKITEEFKKTYLKVRDELKKNYNPPTKK